MFSCDTGNVYSKLTSIVCLYIVAAYPLLSTESEDSRDECLPVTFGDGELSVILSAIETPEGT